MKKNLRYGIGLLCSIGILLTAGAGTETVFATSVGDVIAHAYAVGLPDAVIQQYINQYSGGDYTSAQCDQAIAALDAWAAERNTAIDNVINSTTTTAASGAGKETTTVAVTTTTARGAGGAVQTTAAPAKKAFVDMTLEEKVAYVKSLSASERDTFLANMSNDERNSFLKQMNVTDQVAVISKLLGVGDAFGLHFSVDTLSDGSFAISARDEDGNLVDLTTFGTTVEETGIPNTIPLIAGGSAILLAAGGIGAVLYQSIRRKNT